MFGGFEEESGGFGGLEGVGSALTAIAGAELGWMSNCSFDSGVELDSDVELGPRNSVPSSCPTSGSSASSLTLSM